MPLHLIDKTVEWHILQNNEHSNDPMVITSNELYIGYCNGIFIKTNSIN